MQQGSALFHETIQFQGFRASAGLENSWRWLRTFEVSWWSFTGGISMSKIATGSIFFFFLMKMLKYLLMQSYAKHCNHFHSAADRLSNLCWHAHCTANPEQAGSLGKKTERGGRCQMHQPLDPPSPSLRCKTYKTMRSYRLTIRLWFAPMDE